ncbi:MAG: TerC family protein [Calditrichota bacterium]
MDFSWISSPEAWVAFATLTALEIVLGIDNIIFISILSGRLPEHQRKQGRMLGLGFAMLTRLLLLFAISWVMGLVEPLFEIWGKSISGRDLILIFGGLFLLAKSTHEIHNSLEGEEEHHSSKGSVTMMSVLFQIALIDIVFSLDSVITAVGLVEHVSVMVLAILVSVGVMMLGANAIGDFVEKHPTIKMLALSFLILVGVMLFAEGLGMHVPKGYIYFAMAFSLTVEMLNIRLRKRKKKPIELRKKPEMKVENMSS